MAELAKTMAAMAQSAPLGTIASGDRPGPMRLGGPVPTIVAGEADKPIYPIPPNRRRFDTFQDDIFKRPTAPGTETLDFDRMDPDSIYQRGRNMTPDEVRGVMGKRRIK